MRRKNLLIPILVFIFSFGGLAFYQKSHNTVTLANTTDLPPILWSKTPADISKVVYGVADKQIIAKRENDDWLLVNMNNQKADSIYVYTTINAFLEPKFKEIIAASPKDLKAYGIDDNAPVITLYDTAETPYSLIIGSKANDTLSYVYAPASKTVYSMETSLFSGLSLTTDDWLNKQLLSFKSEDVSKVTLSYKGIETSLLPTIMQNGIDFTSPNLNQALCHKFMNFLQSSKIEQFITDQASEHILQVYGFNNPSLRCTIYLKSGDTLSLIIGMIKEDENICYAMVNHSNSIVAIPYFDFSQFDALFAELEKSDALTLG